MIDPREIAKEAVEKAILELEEKKRFSGSDEEHEALSIAIWTLKTLKATKL